MRYGDILKLEERTVDNLYNIIFVKETNGWLQANEWSAYLCNLIEEKLNNKYKLNVIRKPFKEFQDGIIFVALKLSSFEKYFQNVIIFKNMEDFDTDGYAIFNAKDFLGDDVNFTIETYKDILHEWKNEYKTNKEEKANNAKNVDVDISTKKLFMDILSYPLEKRTPVDNIEFIRQIKDNVLNLI